MASVHAYKVYGSVQCGCGIAKTASRPGKLVFIDATNQVTRALLVATKSPSALLVASPENPIHFSTTHLNDCGKEQSVNPVAREHALSSVLQRSRLTKCLCMGLYRFTEPEHTQQGSDSTAMAICTLRRLSALQLLSSGRCCLRSPNPVVKACNALGSL